VAEIVQVKNKGLSDAMVQLAADAAPTEWRSPTCAI
jgi:hypothetical protein